MATRNKRVCVQLNEYELEALQETATLRGLTVAGYVRFLILDAIEDGQIHSIRTDRSLRAKDLLRLERDMQHMGSSLSTALREDAEADLARALKKE